MLIVSVHAWLAGTKAEGGWGKNRGRGAVKPKNAGAQLPIISQPPTGLLLLTAPLAPELKNVESTAKCSSREPAEFHARKNFRGYFRTRS